MHANHNNINIMQQQQIISKNIFGPNIHSGIEKTQKLLRLTMGPRGKNIVLWDKDSSPYVINDGTSIIKKINNRNFQVQIGQFVIRDIIYNVNDIVGDGTSTTGVLAGEILKKSLNLILTGYDPRYISNGILIGCNLILNQLPLISWPLINNEDILNIATNSAGGDPVLGKMIVNAFRKVGVHGLINIETSDQKETKLSIFGGLQIDRGYVSYKFVNDFAKSVCEYKNCAIFVTDLPVQTLKESIHLMNIALDINKPIIIISDTVEAKPLNAFISNYLNSKIKICLIKIPSFGNYRKSILQDICIATGAEFISRDSGISLRDVNKNTFGSVKRCLVTETTTTLIAKNKYKKDIENRVRYLEKSLYKTDSTFETNLLSERIAKLSGGIATLQVGAPTEIELIDKKLRLEDAKNATFSSLTKGVITGSSIGLSKLAAFIYSFNKLNLNYEEKLGFELILKSMDIPAISIVNNSGEDYISLKKKIISLPFEIGYDAEKKCITNIISEGIIDPASLIYSSLISISKVAKVFLFSNAVIGKIECSKNKDMDNNDFFVM